MSEQPIDYTENRDELNELMAIRRDKLQALINQGIDPYGEKFVRTHTAAEILSDFDSLEGAAGGACRPDYVYAGGHGKASFADLMDQTGRIQLYFRVNTLGEDKYALLQKMDIGGDILGITGKIFKTRRGGEISIEVQEVKYLSKSLRPLPEKWHGLKDVDLRYRQRYVDLIVNPPEVRRVFEVRSKIIQSLRNILTEKGYMEVETPMLNVIAGGGANARPFETHHNALDMDIFLRIAPPNCI